MLSRLLLALLVVSALSACAPGAAAPPTSAAIVTRQAQTAAPILTQTAQARITPTLPPTETPAVAQAPTQGPCVNGLRFVADVTIPDGSTVQRGQSFTKTWRVRNSGTCAWLPGAYEFRHLPGTVFNVNSIQLGAPLTITVAAPVEGGAETELSITFTAPSQPGDYYSYWQMHGPDGLPFGQRPYVHIVVR